jgi:hypothetical protein
MQELHALDIKESRGGIESQLTAEPDGQFSDEANRPAPLFWNEME